MKKSLMLLVIMFFAVRVFHAQTADSILMKYFIKVGGIDKWKGLKSIKMTGKLVMDEGEFPCTLYRKAPNKFKFVLDFKGQQIIPQAFDGETGWMVNPLEGAVGPRKVQEDQVKALRDLSEFEDPFIDYQAKGFVASYEGKGDAGGVQCHIIKLVKNKGIEGREMSSFYYFDAESYLQIMILQPSTKTMGAPIEIFLSDYRDAGDGLLMPFVLDTQMQGQSIQKLSFTTISVNEEMPDDLFKFPVEPQTGVK